MGGNVREGRGVTIQPKSWFQKNDCFFPGCPREATLEACYKRAQIRSCNNPQCLEYAKDMAVYCESAVS